MYRDLQEVYLWEGLNRDKVKFVATCQNYQQVKAERHMVTCLTQVMNDLN